MTDELAPYWGAGLGTPEVYFDAKRLEIIRFCAVECELQRSGERSVYHMLEAYTYAMERRNVLPTQEDIRVLGYLIEPKLNSTEHYRTCAVFVGDNQKAPWPMVAGMLQELLFDVESGAGKPSRWFYRYENIHPFVDGNGRSGAILFNWWRRTLHAPEWAPNFWKDHRRTEEWGA